MALVFPSFGLGSFVPKAQAGFQNMAAAPVGGSAAYAHQIRAIAQAAAAMQSAPNLQRKNLPSQSPQPQYRNVATTQQSQHYRQAAAPTVSPQQPFRQGRQTMQTIPQSAPAITARVNTGPNTGGLDHILCYGDSLTVGFHKGGDAFEPYGYTMTNQLGAMGIKGSKVRVMGLSGKTARECVQGMHSKSIMDIVGNIGKGLGQLLREEGNFDLAIIMLGTNDIGKGYSVSEIMSSIERMHAECHSRNIPTVAIAPTTLDHGTYRAARDQLAMQLQSWVMRTPGVVGFLDLENICSRRDLSLWEPDKIHLSPKGSQTLGRGVGNWLHGKVRSGELKFH